MIKIIPAIDIIEGKCVRLKQGDYEQKTVYNDDPVEVAIEFERYGIRNLHVVDLDGAKSSHIINHDILKRITMETSLKVDFGGGIKSNSDISQAFTSGAYQVTVGSIAVKNPELLQGWISKYGSERIILGADAKDGKISVNGWKEDSTEDLLPFIEKWMKAGIKYVLCTDISKDGMMQGPSFETYKMIKEAFPNIRLIASGGVRNIDDIMALDKMGLYAVVAGKAIYEGGLTLKEINSYITNKERV